MLADQRVRRLLTSDIISGSADAMYWLALVVVLADRDGGSGWVAAAVIARLAPRLLFGAIGGAIADRHDRRRLLMTLDSTRAVVMAALTLTVALDGPPIAAIAAVFVVCSLGTPYRPAVSAALPHLVDEEALGPTNAIWSAVGQAINLAGPVAGLVLLAVGPAWLAFGLNAMSFAIAVVLVLGTGDLGRATEAHERRSPLSELAAGGRAIRADVGLTAITGILAAMMLLRGFELVLHVRVAADQLGLGTAGYGWLSAAIGVGALLAAPFVSRRALPRRPGPLLLTTSLVGCVSLALLALTDRPWIAVLLVAVEGAGIVAFEVAAVTLVQLVTPGALLGRVVGIQGAIGGAAKLLGAVLAPLFLLAFGLRTALILVAVLVAATGLLTARPLAVLTPVASATAARISPVLRTLAAVAVFDGVPATSLQRLALSAVRETVPTGTEIVGQGDPADDFFVIVEGELAVTTDGVEINRLGAGDWFGEIGLITHAGRTASVVAATECGLWRFAGDDFVAAVNTTGTLPDPLVSGMSERIARSERVRSG